MYDLYRKVDNRHLGEVPDEDIQFLINNLEEETLTDKDYAITRLTLEFLRGSGMSAGLAKILDEALGDKDEVEIIYQKK